MCFTTLLLLITPGIQDSTHSAQVVSYLKSTRHLSGGYLATPKAVDPSLSSTSSAIRALQHFGGQPQDRRKTADYLRSCFAPQQGQFSEFPGGPTSYRSTAVGVMGMVALGERFTPAELSRIQETLYKSDQPEEVRLGAAAIESLVLAGQLQHVPADWLPLLNRVFKKALQPDGTYGEGLAKARTTAGYAAAYLRLGYPLGEKDRILKLLQDQQHSSGSWTNEKGEPDLEATYRVMRCLYLMRCSDKELLGRCEKFINSCRQPDGGYGLAGSGSNVPSTYFAGSILHWVHELRK